MYPSQSFNVSILDPTDDTGAVEIPFFPVGINNALERNFKNDASEFVHPLTLGARVAPPKETPTSYGTRKYFMRIALIEDVVNPKGDTVRVPIIGRVEFSNPVGSADVSVKKVARILQRFLYTANAPDGFLAVTSMNSTGFDIVETPIINNCF